MRQLKAPMQESTWLCSLRAVWPWACYLTSLGLSVFIHKMGVMLISISFFLFDKICIVIRMT